jgi:hypothetical protein
MPEDREHESQETSDSRPARRRASDRKKQAERRKVVEAPAEEKASPPQERRERPAERKKPEQRRSAPPVEERPRRARYESVESPPRRQRKDRDRRPEHEPLGDLVEPKAPPEAEIDLAGELDPVWPIGLPIGGSLCLVSVAAAIAALLMARPQQFSWTVIGLLILLLAIAGGGIGVLARKVWGYILAMGASALGAVGGLIWTMYSVVTPELRPWLPLVFCLSNGAAIYFLHQMRWGPGLMTDERERFRAAKRILGAYTTDHGELAYAGAAAAILATLMGLLMIMGANTTSSRRADEPENFADGMALTAFTTAPEQGSIVLARWGNEDYFFLGRLDQSRGDDEFHVTYLDGDEAWVRMNDLRQDTVAAGASVHVHVQGHEGWLPARITQRANNRVEADVGGDQPVWVPLAMIRVRELR